MKILADAHIPYFKGGRAVWRSDVPPWKSIYQRDSRDNDVLIVRTVTHFDEKILAGSNVKLICSATIGFDHIDTHYCEQNNIAWRTAPGCNASSVEQYVTTSIVRMAQKYNFELKDKIIGIVGVGNVGEKVARACEVLGMIVLLNDPPRQETEKSDKFVDLATIQERQISSPFTHPNKKGKYATYHLADKSFQQFRKKPIIINSSRGAVVSNKH